MQILSLSERERGKGRRRTKKNLLPSSSSVTCGIRYLFSEEEKEEEEEEELENNEMIEFSPFWEY